MLPDVTQYRRGPSRLSGVAATCSGRRRTRAGGQPRLSDRRPPGRELPQGTWHHYQLTLDQPGDYLVIDRAGPGLNLDEYRLAQPLMIDRGE
jgi:hypothetical protein